MATTWEVVAVCFTDAAKAEELVRDMAFRRELRSDPERALGAFVLLRDPVPAAITRAVKRIRRARAQVVTQP